MTTFVDNTTVITASWLNSVDTTVTQAIGNGSAAPTSAGQVKTNLGLNNVDNTSDVSKPISTATQTALNLKQNILPTQTGNSGKVLGTDGSNLSWVVGGSGGGGGGTVASVDLFNGGLSPYTLSATPTSLNNIIVVVNGITLSPTLDYTLSGNTLTAVTQWPSGTQNVAVWIIQTSSTGGGGSWGSITGTLSAQTDLQTALNLKADSSSLAAVATSGAYASLSGLPTIPAQFNPIAGTNTSITGTYPNMTFNSTGGGGMVYPVGSGIAVVSSGTSWGTTLAAPASALVGLTDTQALTNKTISGLTVTTTTGTLTLASGKTLTVSNTMTLAGTDAQTYTLPPATCSVGYLNIPQNSQSTAYTCILSDSGKHILHPSADTTARTFTIPANASVAYPIGTAITFVNQNAAGVVTIAITTDTMRLAGAGTTGSRTLAANGVATAIKLTATEWIISGTGLT